MARPRTRHKHPRQHKPYIPGKYQSMRHIRFNYSNNSINLQHRCYNLMSAKTFWIQISISMSSWWTKHNLTTTKKSAIKNSEPLINSFSISHSMTRDHLVHWCCLLYSIVVRMHLQFTEKKVGKQLNYVVYSNTPVVYIMCFNWRNYWYTSV